MSDLTYAILPHKDEFAVCHMGRARVPQQDLFQTVWVLDILCPTMECAIDAQKDLVKKAQVRAASILADMAALERRR